MPYSVGSMLSNIPYTNRPGLGTSYKQRKADLERIDEASDVEKKQFVFTRIKKLTDFAFQNVDFYKSFYTEKGFEPLLDLNSFEDIIKIPIICKADLQKWDVEKRSHEVSNRYKVNTAGSSGVPLDIYIQSDSMGHEWAHMHRVWSKVGFDYTDLKLTLVGRVVGSKFLQYDAARHSYNLNIYADFEAKKDELRKILKTKPIQYIHGYPSAIYQLCVFLQKECNRELMDLFKKSIRGVMLGSEFPPPAWRKIINETFDAPSVSWYGHTERAILAYEREEEYRYYPFLTYGFAEAVESDSGHNLVGTSYHNYASPMIRYNTEDVISEVEEEDGILKSFIVAGGRVGEFILDKHKTEISLTGLIYGRHHKLFNYCSHIQIYQEVPGQAIILYVPTVTDSIDPELLFDSRNIKVEFTFRAIEKPILTKSGKLKLLIKKGRLSH